MKKVMITLSIFFYMKRLHVFIFLLHFCFLDFKNFYAHLFLNSWSF